jgi:multidrug resistance efflux pump
VETLLLLTYLSVCWIIFKVFKIPVNKWTITTVVLGGVILLGVLLGGMAYFHPAAKHGRRYFITTQIVPMVKGKISEVLVKPNVPVKKGDVLCTIDPTPYEARVKDLQAQLDYSRKRLKESRQLVAKAGGSKFEVEKYDMEVRSFEGQLEEARFNLDGCQVRAPGDGFVTHVRVRPGQMAVPLPVASLMTFVNVNSARYIAGFSQQPMQNIHEGNEAEIIFPGIPGRVFKGHVDKVLHALAEGELNATRSMVSMGRQMPEGKIPVIIRLEPDPATSGPFFIPMGADFEAAIYGERWHDVSIIRKVLLRMQSWKYFLKFH